MPACPRTAERPNLVTDVPTTCYNAFMTAIGRRSRAPFLLVIGAICLGVALVVVVWAAARVLRQPDVVTGAGKPGSAAVGSSAAPGEITADLEGSQTYILYLVFADAPDHWGMRGRPTVTAPDGTTRDADDAPRTSRDVHAGGYTAAIAGTFTTGAAGTYSVTVPETIEAGASVAVLAPQESPPDVLTGVVLPAVAACVLGIVGIALLILGIVRRTRTSAP